MPDPLSVLPPLGHALLGELQEVEQADSVLGLHLPEEEREGEGAEEVDLVEETVFRARSLFRRNFFLNRNAFIWWKILLCH